MVDHLIAEAQFLGDLTEDETRALQNYKTASNTSRGLSHCFDLNRLLDCALWPDELPADLRETAKYLDAVLARSPPLPQEVTVFRGDGHRLRFRDIAVVGTSFRNLGYWSTSARRGGAHSFLNPVTKNGFGVVFELRLPRGLRVYNMETLEGAGGSEAELLLPRGILWKVKDVKCPAVEVDLLTTSKFQNIFDVVLEAAEPARPIR